MEKDNCCKGKCLLTKQLNNVDAETSYPLSKYKFQEIDCFIIDEPLSILYSPYFLKKCNKAFVHNHYHFIYCSETNKPPCIWV